MHLLLILVFGDSIRFLDPPTLAPTVVLAEKQLTMPPQKKFKKNKPTETDQEDHYNEQDNRNSFTVEPSQTTDQEWRAKLEALQKARAKKTTHTLEPFAEQDCHTCFSKEKQVHNYMHAKIKFHAYRDI
jgi:hypothetical protein